MSRGRDAIDTITGYYYQFDYYILQLLNLTKDTDKHIAIVGSTGSGKSHTVAKIIQTAIKEKESDFSGLNNTHIIIFDIHSEYKSAFPDANLIDTPLIELLHRLYIPLQPTISGS